MKQTFYCKQCGKPHRDYASNHRQFCSRRCYIKYWHEHVSAKISAIRSVKKEKCICPECGKHFEGYFWSKRVYCSRPCAYKHTLFTHDRVVGPANYNWKNGASLKQFRPRLWRIAVFEKDNYTCQECGKRGGELQADHVKPWADYPELRFDLDNGQCLCKGCHGWKTRLDRFARKNSMVIKEIEDTWYQYL
ncbi:MAG: HNH endonuclease [Crenarchaeota archaeon]|nr:HNH endonuclease [Thermoproteota archaeon]